MDNTLLFFCSHTFLCLPYCRAQNNIVNFSNYCIYNTLTEHAPKLLNKTFCIYSELIVLIWAVVEVEQFSTGSSACQSGAEPT